MGNFYRITCHHHTLWQAAHGDLECGNSGASWRRHLFVAARCSDPHRPLCDWVRNTVMECGLLNTVKTFMNYGIIVHIYRFWMGKREKKKMSHWTKAAGSNMLECSWLLITCVVVRQPAGSQRHPREVCLRSDSRGFLEPPFHGHTGTPRLCEGEGKGNRGADTTVNNRCVWMDMCSHLEISCIIILMQCTLI